MKDTAIETGTENLRWNAILAPTDFSERSQRALEAATYLAGQCGGKITLLHLVQLPASGAIETELAVDAIVNSACASLNEIARQIPKALIDEKLVRLDLRGTLREIVETARNISADLIVIATHGHAPFRRAWMGSMAEALVRQAPCPVLVVRQNCCRNGNGAANPAGGAIQK